MKNGSRSILGNAKIKMITKWHGHGNGRKSKDLEVFWVKSFFDYKSKYLKPNM